MIGESEVPGVALHLIPTNYPDHGHHGRLPLSKKNAHGKRGIEPGTSWLVVRSNDHQATRLVTLTKTKKTLVADKVVPNCSRDVTLTTDSICSAVPRKHNTKKTNEPTAHCAFRSPVLL